MPSAGTGGPICTFSGLINLTDSFADSCKPIPWLLHRSAARLTAFAVILANADQHVMVRRSALLPTSLAGPPTVDTYEYSFVCLTQSWHCSSRTKYETQAAHTGCSISDSTLVECRPHVLLHIVLRNRIHHGWVLMKYAVLPQCLPKSCQGAAVDQQLM